MQKIPIHPMQSLEWGEFRTEWGNKVVKVNNQQITFSKIPHSPWTIGTVFKGPLPNKENIEQLKKVGKKEKAIFIKLEPNEITNNQLNQLGLVKGKRFFTPTTFLIDLTKTEEALLKSFTSKTRYNIKLAQKHGVKVTVDNSDKAFEQYLRLTQETAKRQNFYAHNERYHRLMWKHLKNKIAHLLVATYNHKIISTWILFVYNQVLYYPYGASTDKYKYVMANNLMMWEAVKFGKSVNCHTFDLWGREPGKGFTKFKEGYNPQVVEFVGSWDLVINPFLYWPYRLAEIIRWLVLKTFRM